MIKRAFTGNDTIGSVVAADYKTSTVFYRHDIDFCCKGDKKIGDVCSVRKIDPEALLAEVNEILAEDEGKTDPAGLPLDQLVHYIVDVHHRYVNNHIPVIMEFLNKLCSVHGNTHPELFDVYHLFEQGAQHLLQHMKKEEQVLFPMINNLVIEKNEGRRPADLPYSTQMPIRMMRKEHETEGNRFALIAEVTDHYTVPADGCTTFKATYALLKQFEKDLHRHIHLENNVLFPAALQMEEYES